MKGNNRWMYIWSTVCIVGMTALAYFFKIEMGMKLWITIVFALVGAGILLPAQSRNNELKQTKDWDYPENILYVSTIISMALLVITECLFLMHEFILVDDLGMLGAVIKNLPYLFAASVGFHYIAMAIMAKSQGRRYGLLLVCGILPVVVSLACFFLVLAGYTPTGIMKSIYERIIGNSDTAKSSPLFALCIVLSFPGAFRMCEMEGQGHI